jgi:hypothetical protein
LRKRAQLLTRIPFFHTGGSATGPINGEVNTVANVLPATVTVAATATAIQLTGHHTDVRAINLGTAVVYLRGDGTAAAVAADQNYALTPSGSLVHRVATAPSGGTLALDTGSPVTNLSAIATTGTALVHLFCGCCC